MSGSEIYCDSVDFPPRDPLGGRNTEQTFLRMAPKGPEKVNPESVWLLATAQMNQPLPLRAQSSDKQKPALQGGKVYFLNLRGEGGSWLIKLGEPEEVKESMG